MLEPDTARNRRHGIAMVSVTTLCFAALDSTGKWLVLALPVLQVVWLRFVTHTLLAMVFIRRSCYRWSMRCCTRGSIC